MSEQFVNAEQLGEHLGVSKKTIYNMKAQGRIPAHYLPGSRTPRFRISEVERKMPSRRPRKQRPAGNVI